MSAGPRAPLGVGRQLALALAEAPASPGRMSGRSWAWLGLYVGLSAALLFGLAGLFASNEDTLERALMGFLFPEAWHGVVDFLLAFVFKAQAQQVVINVLLFVTLNLVSLVFFWAKEALSQSYERDLAARAGAGAHGGAEGAADPRAAWREYPIWYQALEEVKWTLVGFALMFVVLWLGHSPEPWRDTAATVLSYLVLFFTTAGNYLAPPMQRRRLQYAQVLKAIFRKPLLAFGFGAAMSLPQVAVLHLVSGADMSAFASLVVIFAVNVVFIAWSAVAGTHAGLALLATAEAARPSAWPPRLGGWLAVFAVLAGGGYVGARLGSALGSKSQILKCSYEVDWSTVVVDTPKLGGLLGGKLGVGVSFEVQIHNPNALPVRIENNRLVVSDDDIVLAESHLLPIDVAANSTTRTRVGLDLVVRATSLLEGARINPLTWDVTLYVALDDDLEFPIYLRGAN